MTNRNFVFTPPKNGVMKVTQRINITQDDNNENENLLSSCQD